MQSCHVHSGSCHSFLGPLRAVMNESNGSGVCLTIGDGAAPGGCNEVVHGNFA